MNDAMKTNAVWNALQRCNEIANNPSFCVSSKERETLDELLAESSNVGVLNRPLEVGASSRAARRSGEGSPGASSSRGYVRPVATASESTSCPPTTNRGLYTHNPQSGNDCSNALGPTSGDDAFKRFDVDEYYSTVPFYGGYDGGCEVGFYGDWAENLETGETVEELRARLLDAKNAAAEKAENGLFDLGGLFFEVRPSGTGGAQKKHKGLGYAYVLDGAGMTVLIHHKPKGDIQPARVRFNFSSLHGRDFYKVYAFFENWLARVGFVVEREVLSRLDLQVTLATPPRPLFDAIQSDCCVARARRESWNGKRGSGAETYTLGGQTQICVYDKFCELLEGGDDEKFNAVLSMFPELVDALTRVEYRIRRDSLKAMQINTIKDLKERERDLIEFLTNDWFRILNRPKTRGNTAVYKNSAFWNRVIEAFRVSFGEKNNLDDSERKPLERRKRNVARRDAVALKSQAVGVLASLGATAEGVFDSPEECRAYLYYRLLVFSDSSPHNLR